MTLLIKEFSEGNVMIDCCFDKYEPHWYVGQYVKMDGDEYGPYHQEAKVWYCSKEQALKAFARRLSAYRKKKRVDDALALAGRFEASVRMGDAEGIERAKSELLGFLKPYATEEEAETLSGLLSTYEPHSYGQIKLNGFVYAIAEHGKRRKRK